MGGKDRGGRRDREVRRDALRGVGCAYRHCGIRCCRRPVSLQLPATCREICDQSCTEAATHCHLPGCFRWRPACSFGWLTACAVTCINTRSTLHRQYHRGDEGWLLFAGWYLTCICVPLSGGDVFVLLSRRSGLCCWRHSGRVRA